VGTARCNPLSTGSPAGSSEVEIWIAARTLPSTRMCPSPASAQSRAASHRPDRAVVAAPREPDSPERRVSVRDDDAEAERVPGRAPSNRQLRQPRSHCCSHSRRSLARIRGRDRIGPVVDLTAT
jgi:hypothetical protein